MIYVLHSSIEYQKNTYYLEKYDTKEEAINSIKDNYGYISDYIFIEGRELELTLKEVER